MVLSPIEIKCKVSLKLPFTKPVGFLASGSLGIFF